LIIADFVHFGIAIAIIVVLAYAARSWRPRTVPETGRV
jgi:hypothetical protein